ncbi:PFA3 [Symbiodinium sp. CCMP2592]|nr:PFA3 [Symbiodinium sp. CCMP2592]
MPLPPTSPTSQESEASPSRAFPQSSSEYVCYGKDFKPFLPHILCLSIVTGAAFMTFVQVPMLCSMKSVAQAPFIAVELALHAMALGLMAYCGYSDPGQLRKTRDLELGQSGEDIESGRGPKRSHKSFQYNRRIRRYDHYCKWVNFAIGLLNHREFVVLLFALCLIEASSLAFDAYLALLLAQKGFWKAEIGVLSHFAFAVILLYILGFGVETLILFNCM